jgi:Bifunctional DNA primase/polymerase, N-terminal
MDMASTSEGPKTINDWANFWRNNIGANIIPANTRKKETYESWKEWQDKPIPQGLHDEWNTSGAFNHGMAVILGKVWHNPVKNELYLIGIDLDNRKAIEEVAVKGLEDLAKNVIVEQHVDDPSKAHILLYSHKPFPKKSSDNNGHLTSKLNANEVPAIEVKGLGSHGILFVTPSIHKNGQPYQIRGTLEPVIADDFVNHIDDILKKYSIPYLDGNDGNGNGLVPIQDLFKPDFTISGGHNRHEALMRAMESLIARNSSILSQDQIKSLSRQWNDQHCSPPLDDREFEKQWKCATDFIDRKGSVSEGGEEDDDLTGIHNSVLEKLSSHIYSIISSNPPVMYVAHKGKRKIIKAIIKFATETTGNRQEQKMIKQLLLWKQQLIFALPVKVIINDSPIDENKTYQITFIGKSKNPFTIGPGSINYIIEELAGKGKVLRKAEAVDALTAIINRYEELGLAEVKESVTKAGYYYIKGKFESYEITQTIDKDPDPEQVLACTNFLDELSTKWQNKDIFPTVIKWTTLAPFSYIFKAIDKWLKNIHGYGWSSSGKTSLGEIALAVWRLHTNVLKKDYQLSFGNIDNAARFGAVISKSTYPKVINEVGGLQDKFSRSLLELIKGGIEAPFVRGKFFDGKYQNIPALCNLYLTSNSKPPDDSGYRGKSTLIQHTKDEVHERGQKEAVEFEKWLDSKLNILGVLGDFIAKEILTEFYKSVGKDKPEWLDWTFAQRSIVEENTEWAYFEVRSLLMDRITDAYSRHIRTLYKEQDPGITIDFSTRLNFCIKNKLLPFLHSHTRKDNTEEIAITHDILKELTKNLDHIEGITTLEDLGKEIPGFLYCQRKLGPNNRNTKVLAGKRDDLAEFLEGDIEDDI